jgi:Rrf2 family transcriptional regulator, nitric oxide-sensitive transcriptional repressor
MRLTQFTDYSLRMLIYVAAHPEERATIAEVASSYGISENHLIKVAHFLGHAGYLATLRGRGGGLRLARPAKQINVGLVVRETEGVDIPAACFDVEADPCPIERVCRLRGVLKEAVQAFYTVLERYTLEDLVLNRQRLRTVLLLPRASAP